MRLSNACRVLIIEDNADHREMIGRGLRRAGRRVEEASTGEEGLSRLRRAAYDVVLLDLSMPGLDGLSLLHRMGRPAPDPAGSGP